MVTSLRKPDVYVSRSGVMTNTRTLATATTTVFDASMRPFAASSPFNTPTPLGTVWYDTPRLHTLVNGTSVLWYPGVGGDPVIWYGTPSDPLWTFDMADYIYLPWHRNNPAQITQWHAPVGMNESGANDHLLCLVDTTTGDYIEVWNAQVNTVTRTVTSGNPANSGLIGWARGNILTGDGCGKTTTNDGTRASNYSWMAGAITGRDIAAGSFDHALAVAGTGELLDNGSSWIAPATAPDASWAGTVKMGSKIGIPAGVSRPGSLTGMGIAIFNCLQTYGAYVGDFAGGDWPVIYCDKNTVSDSDADALRDWVNPMWSVMAPLLRVADYQP